MPRLMHRCRRLIAACLAALVLPQAAMAYNVPGSAQAQLPELVEIATGMIVRTLRDGLDVPDDDAPGFQISSMGSTPTGLRVAGGGMMLSFGVEVRDVDHSRLDGTVSIGTLSLARRGDSGLILFGALIGEANDLRTILDDGRIENSGLGLAFGLRNHLSLDVTITALAGFMALEYDVMRGGGAFTGAFDARRQFVDVNVEGRRPMAGGEFRFGGGFLYVHQSNDGYTETGGGAVVAPYSFDVLDLTLNLRQIWGQPGQLRPFVDLAARSRLSGPDTFVALGSPDQPGWTARLAGGVERVAGMSSFSASLGANFGEDGFEGLDGSLRYILRF